MILYQQTKKGDIMNIHQTNRSNMIEAVLSYLTLHSETITQSTGLAGPLRKVKDLMEAIWVKSNEKSAATNGKTAKKRDSGNALEKQTVKIAAALFLWAKQNNNYEVKQLSKLTKSGFEQLRDAERINRAKAIYNATKGKDLLFANVIETDIELLNTLANEHKQDIANVSLGATKRIAAGQTLDQMLDEAVTILNEEFDKYLLIYEDSKPEFYKGYKAARVIWDKGGKQVNNNVTETQAAVKSQVD